DWALLRIPGRDLPHATIADYTELRPGDKLVVVSSPSGLENTVSEGIVSGLRRAGELSVPNWQALEELGFEQDSELIQFSAPISPGSSGGPVFNARGEVVGIVILKHHADNVYFATPAKLALEAMDREEITAFDAMDLGAIGGERIDTGRNPSSVGRGEPVRATMSATVPSKGMPLVQLEHTRFVLPESVEIEDRDTSEKLRLVDRPPAAGEFRSVSGGRLYFNETDAGRRLRVTYDYCVQRIAVLPPLDLGDRPELREVFVEALQGECVKRGFEPAPQAESEGSFYALNLPGTLDKEGLLRELEPEVIRRLAAEINARYVIATGVGDSGVGGARGFGVNFDGYTGELLARSQWNRKRSGPAWGDARDRREYTVRQVAGDVMTDLLDQE
ncbi:MAG: trypsin-like peptidase domain-containing protein, partial [Armatimonadetes bacterium]|nr:trypsin-like peptidase domain-containing protein [Armatimonadota bacterium]